MGQQFKTNTNAVKCQGDRCLQIVSGAAADLRVTRIVPNDRLSYLPIVSHVSYIGS